MWLLVGSGSSRGGVQWLEVRSSADAMVCGFEMVLCFRACSGDWPCGIEPELLVYCMIRRKVFALSDWSLTAASMFATSMSAAG